MLDAVGQTADAEVQRTRAAQVQTETHAQLWQPARGHYRVHAHATEWTDPFDEDAVVPISSVLSIYAGIASPDQVAPIFAAAAHGPRLPPAPIAPALRSRRRTRTTFS